MDHVTGSGLKTTIAEIQQARHRPAVTSGPPASEIDAAIAAYQKASRENREAADRLERAHRDHSRAEDAATEARKALVAARVRLDKALDADGAQL